MYEPEMIIEIQENNENKKYILAGYDKISEESEEKLKKESDNENNNIEETSSLNNNTLDIKQLNSKITPNNSKKNTFFEECNNKINKKALKISPNLRKKIESNIYIQNDKLKNKKININYNNINYNKQPLKQKVKIDKKNWDISFENNIENKDSNNNIEVNTNGEDNNIKTLSLNTFRGNNTTERNNDTENSFKAKKHSGHKMSNRNSLAQNNLQVREINLRFILTKEEYAILMREKAKNQDSLINS